MAGPIVAWGDDSNRQIRDVPPGNDFERVVPGGADQSLAIRADGSLVMWGTSTRPFPVPPLPAALASAKGCIDASISLRYMAVVLSDGSIVPSGTLPAGLSVPSTGRFLAVAVGFEHGVAIRDNGELQQWGQGEGAKTPPAGHFGKIRARSGYTIALTVDGKRLYAWGANIVAGNKVVNGWKTDNASLGHFYVEADKNRFTDLAAGVVQKDPRTLGLPHILALQDDGTVIGWGQNFFGETTPPSGKFLAVAAGLDFSIGLSSPGTLRHWGENNLTSIAGGIASVPTSTSLHVPPGGLFSSISSASQCAFAVRILDPQRPTTWPPSGSPGDRS